MFLWESVGLRLRSGVWVALLASLVAPLSRGAIPDSLVEMQEGAAAILVEKDAHRLSIYKCVGGRPVLATTYQVTTGQGIGDKRREGDLRTPEGVYFFTRFIDGSRLPAEYGAGAIVMDYPNPLDQLQGKNGDGIWLHATDEPARLKQPYSTRGCVVLSNEHFSAIKRSVVLHYTPIIVTRQARLVSEVELATDRAQVEDMVERWRQAWERAEVRTYLSCYDSRFRSRGMNLSRYAAYKTDVFGRSRDIHVTLSDLQIYREGSLLAAQFFQDFRSNLMGGRGGKTLHCIRTDSGWKIIGETMHPLSEYQDHPALLAKAFATPPSVTAPVATPAVARLAPKNPPTLLGTDTRLVTVQGLSAEFPAPGRMEVSFELRNTNPSGERVVGRLAVLVHLDAGDQRRDLAYPATAIAGGGAPNDLAARGEYFSIRRFKVVRAPIPLPTPSAAQPDTVRICVYDNTGKPILIKDFPLTDRHGLADAQASLSWKEKR